MCIRDRSDTGEETQRTVSRAIQEVEEARSTEASEFAETTMLEDLYADPIEEVDTAAPITTEELTVTQPQAQDLFSEDWEIAGLNVAGQTGRSTDTYSSIRVEMTPAKFLEMLSL